MLDRNGRIAVVLAAVIVAVAAFLILSPGDDETEPTSTTTVTPAATTPAATETAPATETPTAAPTEEPGPAIEVRDGAVVGGVEEISVKQGDTVEFSVASDAPDHVHVHGYDIKKDLEAGSPARISFDADITGIFEIELEEARLHIANLRVEP